MLKQLKDTYNKFDTKSKIIVEIIVISLFITIISTTYAFFTIRVNGNSNDNVIKTGSMLLSFEDGAAVNAKNILPGQMIQKTFKVENIGDLPTNYDVYLSEIINTFVDKEDLVYSVSSDSDCIKDETIMPDVNSSDLKAISCMINPKEKQEYTLNILFKETGDNQDDNKGATFSAKLAVNEVNSAQDIKDVKDYAAAAKEYYAVNPQSELLGSNISNKLNVANKISGDKVILTKDGKTEIAIKRSNRCYRKSALSDNIDILEENLCNANIGNFVSNNGHLHVSGTKLMNERNEEVRLTGIGGGNYGAEITDNALEVNKDSLASIKNWGANVYRVFINSRKSWTLNYIDHEDEYIEIVKNVIDAAIENDMYIILNWDPYGNIDNDDNNPFTNYALDFFTRIARLYPNDAHIIFELWNEPTENTKSEAYLNHMNTIIPAIREISKDSLILTSYIGGINNLKNNLLPYDNLMYVVHNYMNALKSTTLDNIANALDNNIPIFITEWGAMGIGANYRKEEIMVAQANAFLKFLNSHNLSYSYFSFGAVISDSDIQYGIVKKGQWRNDLANCSLTINGKFAKAILSNSFITNKNLMMENSGDFYQNEKHGHTYRSLEYKDKIVSIEFKDTLQVDDNAVVQWDLSFNKDNSVIGYLINSDITDMYKLIICANGKISAPSNMLALFANMSNLKTIDFTNFVVENVSTITGIFAYDYNLESLDLSTFDVSKLERMNSAFISCINLKSINFDNWHSAPLVQLAYAFNSCYKLEELDLTGLNVSQLSDFSGLFVNNVSLKKVNIANWNPKNTKSINSLFKYCKSLEYVDMRLFNIDSSVAVEGALVGVKENTKFVVNNQNVIDILTPTSTNNIRFELASNFATDSWSTILANVRAGRGDIYAPVSNLEVLRKVDMGDLGTHYLRVANTTKCSDSLDSQSACGFVIEFADTVGRRKYNDNLTTEGGYPASNLHDYVNSTIYDALPLEIKNSIIDTKVISSHGSTSGEENFVSNNEKVYLLDLEEVMGNSDPNNTAYNTTRQLDYYRVNSSSARLKKYDNNTYGIWWLRTAYSSSNKSYASINEYEGFMYHHLTNNFGVSPAFRIG